MIRSRAKPTDRISNQLWQQMNANTFVFARMSSRFQWICPLIYSLSIWNDENRNERRHTKNARVTVEIHVCTFVYGTNEKEEEESKKKWHKNELNDVKQWKEKKIAAQQSI